MRHRRPTAPHTRPAKAPGRTFSLVSWSRGNPLRSRYAQVRILLGAHNSNAWARKNSSRRASLAAANDGVAFRRSAAALWSRFAIATSNLVRSVVPATAIASSLATDDPVACDLQAEDDPAAYRDLPIRTDCPFAVRRGLGIAFGLRCCAKGLEGRP